MMTIKQQYNTNFTPEDANEELLILVGRVEAVGAYLSRQRYSVDRELIADMLGIELADTLK